MNVLMKKFEVLRMLLKQILQKARVDTVAPIVLLFIVNLVAFLNEECCIMVFLVLPVALSSFYIYCAKKCAR